MMWAVNHINDWLLFLTSNNCIEKLKLFISFIGPWCRRALYLYNCFLANIRLCLQVLRPLHDEPISELPDTNFPRFLTCEGIFEPIKLSMTIDLCAFTSIGFLRCYAFAATLRSAVPHRSFRKEMQQITTSSSSSSLDLVHLELLARLSSSHQKGNVNVW